MIRTARVHHIEIDRNDHVPHQLAGNNSKRNFTGLFRPKLPMTGQNQVDKAGFGLIGCCATGWTPAGAGGSATGIGFTGISSA
jgi:hypothetical protein